MKIVYALPFEPVVWSRSILGLGLPSSANGNCEWPLPVHWNCLFVSNQGAFNVSRVNGWSALILREGSEYRGTSPCQILSKLVHPSWRYSDFSISQNGRRHGHRRHLDFEFAIFYWLTGSRGSRCISLPNFVKIGQSVVKILIPSQPIDRFWRNFSIFQDGGRPPSWYCLGHIWTTHREYLGRLSLYKI